MQQNKKSELSMIIEFYFIFFAESSYHLKTHFLKIKFQQAYIT